MTFQPTVPPWKGPDVEEDLENVVAGNGWN